MGDGDHLMSNVLEDDGSVQVDDVVPGQDVGHGGVHERDDDDLEENEYGEGDLQIDRLDQLTDHTFDNGVPADRSGDVEDNTHKEKGRRKAAVVLRMGLFKLYTDRAELQGKS
ncbi:hypothetical protein E3N88_28662 [Mikania micrantha]|uniref:Uncharacterized protein n=1 Tax=Mikania micrantha TaxID=192012 RepID=A0A5N6N0N5_9ASTR|nr:hypothetical protein E3N88_28662 [Mikania micrantha]